MANELSLAFIGGGNMAGALASGLIGKRCGAHDVHIIDPDASARERWARQGVSVAEAPGSELSALKVWVFAVKPQVLKDVVMLCRPFLQPDTLVISIAAGISAHTLAGWLGEDEAAFTRLVRCMPNTPALIGCGASGLMALDGVTEQDRMVAQQMLGAVGEVVWVDTDAQIDAVTALSGSGPAYVFLFLESLIRGGIEQGLTQEQARTLAFATVRGATELAALSHESLATLRERVTSKGGTTAAALQVFENGDFAELVGKAMRAAGDRAAELSREFS
ncbi:pyrroline-5-carboxylate reductase [Pusillimonas sp. ANT_WB101]|uniref:pyrroline-5-carboxylate reductase n=1 Tax=Pusillimonas sp. ANT_WB101 TaxID=2597356 RepID=UPI0011ED58EE|nr:pyrroline-5-carboxylate reductase [Pusillimonas sp. ANT_WB101]KAA0911956.1 pyrroline-5-carboxylate reductase [Pusillimonas sp. ANT_WB101]